MPMTQRGTKLVQLARQLKDERVQVLYGLPVATFVFFLILLVAFQVLWLLHGTFIPYYTRLAAEDSGLWIFCIGLGISLLLGIVHYIALYFGWHKWSKTAAQIVIKPTFMDAFFGDELISMIKDAKFSSRHRSNCNRPWVDPLRERIEIIAAFLTALPVWEIEHAGGERLVRELAVSNWLASNTGSWVVGLGSLVAALPRFVKFIGWIGMLILYPLLLPGGHPYMRRNAAACAIVERLLEEQVKPQPGA